MNTQDKLFDFLEKLGFVITNNSLDEWTANKIDDEEHIDWCLIIKRG